MRATGWISLFVSVVVLVWIAADGDRWDTAFAFRGQKGGSDYYNLLVDGFLEGHLYMKAEVHPARLSPDPEVRRNAPYLLDASLYRGHYYLYFGVVPAVLTFLPYSYFTGHDLPENAATLFFVLGGFLAYVCVYHSIRRRYLAQLWDGWDAVAVFGFAFVSGTPVLVMDAGFYEIAIAGGYCCFAWAVLGLFYALHEPARATWWTMFASFWAGLAVGCRPTYLLALPILLTPALLVGWQHRSSGASIAFRSCRRLLASAILPAAAVGAALMVYNYERFDDPFEFGFRYQLNELMSSGLPFARFAFIPKNVAWYYLWPPELSPFFPFVFPLNASDRPATYYGYEPIHGQFVAFCLIVLCVGVALLTLYRSNRKPVELVWFAAALAVGGGLLTLCLTSFGFRANRYIVDFHPSLVTVALVLGSYTVATLERRWLRRSLISATTLLILAAGVLNVLIAIQTLDHLANTRPKSYRLLSHLGNVPAGWLDRLGWLPRGPLRFTVRFTQPPHLLGEPLVATGAPNYSDVLRVKPLAGWTCELEFLHEGNPPVSSLPITFEPNRDYAFSVEMGSLYPPTDHRFFDGWPAQLVSELKDRGRVFIDGQLVFDASLKFHDSPPGAIVWGRVNNASMPNFSGKITGMQRLPSTTQSQLTQAVEFGVWRFDLEFPPGSNWSHQPILGSGRAGAGNMLTLAAAGPESVQFHLDEWGVDYQSSPRISIQSRPRHVLEIVCGPQVLRQQLPPNSGISSGQLETISRELVVRIDETTVWRATLRGNLDSYDHVSLGSNPQGFSTAARSYQGVLRKHPLSAARQYEILRLIVNEPHPRTD